MKRWEKYILLGVGLVITSACGGSEELPGLSDPPPQTQSFSELLAQEAALSTQWASASFSDPTTLPTIGTATYAGIVRIAVETGGPEIQMAGDFGMIANFQTTTVSGTAGGFVDQTDQTYAGVLNMANGSIDRAADTAIEYTFVAEIDGTLSGGGTIYDITALLGGDFLDPDYGAIDGVISGTVTSGIDSGLIYGDFIAEQ
jgi:hypothetical protein